MTKSFIELIQGFLCYIFYSRKTSSCNLLERGKSFLTKNAAIFSMFFPVSCYETTFSLKLTNCHTETCSFIILDFLGIEKNKCCTQAKSHRHTAKDGGSYKVSIFISFDVDMSPIQQDLGTFIHPTLDQRLYPGLGFRRNQGPYICPGLITLRIQMRTISLYQEQYYDTTYCLT